MALDMTSTHATFPDSIAWLAVAGHDHRHMRLIRYLTIRTDAEGTPNK